MENHSVFIAIQGDIFDFWEQIIFPGKGGESLRILHDIYTYRSDYRVQLHNHISRSVLRSIMILFWDTIIHEYSS